MEGLKQMSIQQLTCFKADDVRGALNVSFDTDIAYLIGHAVAQKFQPKKIMVVTRCARYATKVVMGSKYVKV